MHFYNFVFQRVTSEEIEFFTASETFTRGAGKPVTFTRTFEAPDPSLTYTLRVQNGNDGARRVSSASLSINGTQILRSSDFNQQVSFIEREIRLEQMNTLEVRLASAPSSFLVVTFTADSPNLSYSTPPDPDKIVTDPNGGVYPVNQLAIILDDGYSRSDVEEIATSVGGRVIGFIPLANLYQLEVPSNTIEELESLIGVLEVDPRIISVMKNLELQLNAVTTDLGNLRNSNPNDTRAYDKIKVDDAWRKIAEMQKQKQMPLHPVVIGIVDTGIDQNHPEFHGVPVKGAAADESFVTCDGKTIDSHGTQVAGIIGANNLSSISPLPPGSPDMNGILSGVVGINNDDPRGSIKYELLVNPQLSFIRRLYKENGFEVTVFDRINESIRLGAQVINLSYGASLCGSNNECGCIPTNQFDNRTDTYKRIFTQAPQVLFVASAGNGSRPARNHTPGGSLDLPNLITVGATTLADSKTDFSNFGAGVDISAPGEQVYAPGIFTEPLNRDDYQVLENGEVREYFKGTSASAPMVAGVAGLIKAIKPELTPAQIKKILVDTGQPLPGQDIGPLLDAYEAVCHQDVLNCAPQGEAPQGILNDTGISWCANDTTNNLACPVSSHRGQDGDHGRDALARDGQLQKVGGGNAGFDFTKLDANGNALPASATNWTCVRDNHTGLIWEVKTTSGLRSMYNTYTWYDPNSPDGNPGTANGGNCTGSACDTTGFVQAVNQQGLCGASDWRMPTWRELQGIVDYGRFKPAIDSGYFPYTRSLVFWSASPNANHSDGAWVVYFNRGNASNYHRSYGHHVRLVRGGQ